MFSLDVLNSFFPPCTFPNYDEMRKELDIDWEKELGDSNPIDMLNKVMEKLNKTIDKNIP
jgi:hypothetical protein